MTVSISPRQVARALDIGESTVKRWCDKGLIQTIRTAGGHRKLALADVLRFVREQGHPLVSPELLGLPPVGQQERLDIARSRARLVATLLDGDELLARQIVFNLYLANHAVSAICDEVIGASFHEIGDRWACQEADVYQERRGCEIAIRILLELRKLQEPPDPAWPAIGGTMEGDPYALPSLMADLVLRNVGFQATSLGVSIPFPSLIKAVEQTKPKLFWLSVSHIRNELDFVREFPKLSAACSASGAALVVGGRALHEDLRQRMVYSAYCDTMQHLETFARTLLRHAASGDKHTLSKAGVSQRAATTKRPLAQESSDG